MDGLRAVGAVGARLATSSETESSTSPAVGASAEDQSPSVSPTNTIAQPRGGVVRLEQDPSSMSLPESVRASNTMSRRGRSRSASSRGPRYGSSLPPSSSRTGLHTASPSGSTQVGDGRRGGGGGPTAAALFSRNSTTLRSNVADRVQRDLLPVGRLLSVFLVACELFAELLVSFWTKSQPCDRPLRLWVQLLMALQTATIVLNCLNICFGRDPFHPHRLGLGASDVDMYMGAPRDDTSAPTRQVSPPNPYAEDMPLPVLQGVLGGSQVDTQIQHGAAHTAPVQSLSHMRIEDISRHADPLEGHYMDFQDFVEPSEQQPLLNSSTSLSGFEQVAMNSNQGDGTRNNGASSSATPGIFGSPHSDTNFQERHTDSSYEQRSVVETVGLSVSNSASYIRTDPNFGSVSSSSSTSSSASLLLRTSSVFAANDYVDRYIRIVNAWYLVWYIVGSVWVSDAGTCALTAPGLYRLTLSLTIIYFTLLFLPLACFCLIVCCLPLFILVYRIMLPYAERERRQARAVNPSQIAALTVATPYSRRPSSRVQARPHRGVDLSCDEDAVCAETAQFRSETRIDSGRSIDGLDSQSDDEDPSCVICLCAYEPGEMVRTLPCKHHFHAQCIDEWLQLDKSCALCKQDVDQTPNRLRVVSVEDGAV